MNIDTLLTGQGLMFLFFASAAILSGLLVVLLQNPLRAALSLVLNLFSIAGLYLSLNAYFLATVQVIVYAGAIMVLFLFVIMLLNLGQPGNTASYKGVRAISAFSFALGTAGLLGLIVFRGVLNTPLIKDPIVRGFTAGSVEGIGHALYDPKLPWLFTFEWTSVLLLIAVIGSVVLAGRRIDTGGSK